MDSIVYGVTKSRTTTEQLSLFLLFGFIHCLTRHTFLKDLPHAQRIEDTFLALEELSSRKGGWLHIPDLSVSGVCLGWRTSS